MPDPRFFTTTAPLTIDEACAVCGAAIAPTRDDDAGEARTIKRVAALNEEDLTDALVYAMSPLAFAKLDGRRFGLCLTTALLAEQAPSLTLDGVLGVCSDPKAAFGALSSQLHASIWEGEIAAGEAPMISASARIGANVRIGPGAVIGSGVEIGAGSRVGAGAVISHALIGERVVIGAGVVVGEPGFGFAAGATGLKRLPQLGIVEIGDDVEVGANCTIDRAALGATVIGAGTKIDNLVHIGHNVRIGRNVVIVAQAGVGGSSVVGDNALIGGQVGIADHIVIGAGAQVASKAGVMRDIPAGEKWGGFPARRAKDWLRETLFVERETKKKRKTN